MSDFFMTLAARALGRSPDGPPVAPARRAASESDASPVESETIFEAAPGARAPAAVAPDAQIDRASVATVSPRSHAPRRESPPSGRPGQDGREVISRHDPEDTTPRAAYLPRETSIPVSFAPPEPLSVPPTGEPPKSPDLIRESARPISARVEVAPEARPREGVWREPIRRGEDGPGTADRFKPAGVQPASPAARATFAGNKETSTPTPTRRGRVVAESVAAPIRPAVRPENLPGPDTPRGDARAVPGPAPEAAPAETIVSVTIGRIDIRAVGTASTPTPGRGPEPMGLDRYLGERSGSGRGRP